MKYLEQIIKETLRLYPPLPLIPRIVEEEIKIKNYTLPVGTIVLINLLVTQRHPKSISNPDKFNPDNFSTESKTTRNTIVYTPFSVGLRTCVGKNYAMLQMKVMLSTILRYYKILPVGELADLDRLEVGVILSTKLGARSTVPGTPTRASLVSDGSIFSGRPLSENCEKWLPAMCFLPSPKSTWCIGRGLLKTIGSDVISKCPIWDQGFDIPRQDPDI
uniref:Cytochrome P450 n=1 Tax=Timema monikensis TaxID=170555 RepID=A0A7R9ECN6_9NEOP|nr:unnamed protein product [Timema monikensis]